MSDKHHGYVVTLDTPLHEEASSHVIDAIRLLKGVVSVKPIVGDPGLALAEERARADLRERLWRALDYGG